MQPLNGPFREFVLDARWNVDQGEVLHVPIFAIFKANTKEVARWSDRQKLNRGCGDLKRSVETGMAHIDVDGVFLYRDGGFADVSF